MRVAVPIAPRFLAFLALAASLTLDLLFFFGARGSSASFTLELFFDRGAGGGHEPPRSASALVGRGRAASAATVNAASRARARSIVAPQLLRVALLCAECHGKSHRCDSLLRPAGQVHYLAAPADRRYSTPYGLLELAAPASQPQVRSTKLCASALQDASKFRFGQASALPRGSYGLENRFDSSSFRREFTCDRSFAALEPEKSWALIKIDPARDSWKKSESE